MRVQFVYCVSGERDRVSECVRLRERAPKTLFISSNDDNNNEIIFYLFLQMRMNTRAHSNATKTLVRVFAVFDSDRRTKLGDRMCARGFGMCLPECVRVCARGQFRQNISMIR